MVERDDPYQLVNDRPVLSKEEVWFLRDLIQESEHLGVRFGDGFAKESLAYRRPASSHLEDRLEIAESNIREYRVKVDSLQNVTKKIQGHWGDALVMIDKLNVRNAEMVKIIDALQKELEEVKSLSLLSGDDIAEIGRF